MSFQETVGLKGYLIDSGFLKKAFDCMVANKGGEQAMCIVTGVAFFFKAIADNLLYAKRM